MEGEKEMTVLELIAKLGTMRVTQHKVFYEPEPGIRYPVSKAEIAKMSTGEEIIVLSNK